MLRRLWITAIIALTGTTALVSSQAQSTAAGASAQSVVAVTDGLFKETSRLRDLPILRPVNSIVHSRADIERLLLRALDEHTTPDELQAAEAGLKKMGLLPMDFEYRNFIVRLMTDELAGAYEPASQTLNLPDWLTLEAQSGVIVHELTHALQDQHFDLKRFVDWPKGDSDAELAAHCLIEGDAVLAMSQYLSTNLSAALALLASIQATGPRLVDQAPRVLRESLLFPYVSGIAWVTDLHTRGGWTAVSAAFSRLPESTEQVMHVDKYLARESPVRVTLPDTASILGNGWTRVMSDVNGEFGFYLILDHFLNAEADSKQAAAGWGGDRFDVYRGPSPADVLVTQMSVWDTPADAREFAAAYVRRTALRYPGATSTSVLTAAPTGLQSWSTSEGDVVVELRNQRVLIVEGVPAAARARLLQTLWQ